MEKLLKDLGMQGGELMNDFKATSYGLFETKKDECYQVAGGERVPYERTFMIGAGTGLG